MTEGRMARRYDILESIIDEEKREQYSIRLFDSFIDIRNNRTQEGIYTDSLQYAKRWIVKDLKNIEVKENER